MEKRISVVIPCCQKEEGIWEFFQSLKNQSIGAECLDIMFVSDVSADRMKDKLAEARKDYPNSVRIIPCEEGSGPGTAYNVGLSYACAPFVFFADGDGGLDTGAFEKMYGKAAEHDCDVVYSCMDDGSTDDGSTDDGRVHGGGTDSLLLIDSQSKRKQFLLDRSMGNTVSNKLFRRELLLENEIFFPQDLYYGEDYWSALLHLHANRVYFMECTSSMESTPTNTGKTAQERKESHISDLLTVNLLKWQEWENRGLLKEFYEELCYDFLCAGYLGYLKELILKCRKPSYEEFLALKDEVLARIPDYAKNPYIVKHAEPFERLLFDLLRLPITKEVFKQVVLQARINWKSVQIFVATHVNFPVPAEKTYRPIHVGKAGRIDLGYPGDDTGEHISEQNKYYGELTGLYWIWKNYHASDYVGLCHYRRYFINEKGAMLKKEDYIRILSDYDVMLAKPIRNLKSYIEMYEEAHNINDLLAVERAIEKRYPRYSPFFREVMEGKDSYVGNLFAAPKELWDAYASWLFEVFQEASAKIHPDAYDSYHRRVYGFMSEQLLFVWIRANNLSWYGCPIGLSQEKAETTLLKEYMYELLLKREFKKAWDEGREYMKDRPDVLLEASDVNGTLPLLFQLAHIGMENPDTDLVREGDSLEEMLGVYKEFLRRQSTPPKKF